MRRQLLADALEERGRVAAASALRRLRIRGCHFDSIDNPIEDVGEGGGDGLVDFEDQPLGVGMAEYSLYRGGNWPFEATGEGDADGLTLFLREYREAECEGCGHSDGFY